MSTATYAKLRDGSWGIRVQGIVASGAVVDVRKKSGETKREIVAAVLWTGQGVSLCSIAGSSAPRRERNDGLHYERGCGLVCDECGEAVRKGTRCWETGALH